MPELSDYQEEINQLLKSRYPSRPEFHQAVKSVSSSVLKHICETSDDIDRSVRVLKYLIEPDRIVNFRVAWQDDDNCKQFNRGFRVQHNNSLGPYKGGLRFGSDVNVSVLQFLGFEQTFKNALTGLPMGGAKGGADFDPRERSEGEIERFCRAFMGQLARYIGTDQDIPAGDIGVGAQEIAYMFDEHKNLTGEFSGVLTGKDPVFGGSCFREEATGYGCVYFAEEALEAQGDKLAGKRCLISGAGNVSLHAAEKLLDCDAQVISLSSRAGFLHFEEGLDKEQLESIKQHRKSRGSLESLAEKEGWEFSAEQKPWGLEADLAFPCATQNELELADAEQLVEQGCNFVFEGANMPCTEDAISHFQENGVVFGPSKAVNAGGVAVSGIEISQNRSGQYLSSKEVEAELKRIMQKIHSVCCKHGKRENGDIIDYKLGSSIAAFEELSNAASLYGVN